MTKLMLAFALLAIGLVAASNAGRHRRHHEDAGHHAGDGHNHLGHDAVANEVEEVVGDMIEGCFARPSGGCLCTVGKDDDGRLVNYE